MKARGVMWMGAYHDPLVQTIGRVLNAGLFYEEQSKTHFIAAVIGYYDPAQARPFRDFAVLSEAESWEEEYWVPSDEWEWDVRLALNPREVEASEIAEILAGAPTFVADSIEPRVRKAFDPTPIIEIYVPLWLLANNPFAKKFLERYGEKAADLSMQLIAWLAGKVSRALKGVRAKRVLFELASDYRGCRIEFVVDSKEPDVVSAACRSVQGAAQDAMRIVNGLEDMELTKLVYEYDLKAERWLPLHAAGKRVGVIADRPMLIAVSELPGLSLGGVP